MSQMFSNNAEFDNLIEETSAIKVSSVNHRAMIEVDEKGTTATAVTGFTNFCTLIFLMLNFIIFRYAYI